ncbi:hypothetical protein ACFYWY_25690 [Streptomyces sp. NPDC002870]|uniref:hypothetical protein n=1 Tax=Streptomyces sp. NPDC002870 TaxID=3364666 RepID=UPI0036A94875
MSDDDVVGDISPQGGYGQPVRAPLPLPLDYEGFYLGHQEFFHAFAEIHLGSRRAAEEVAHQVFLEILAGWEQLLQEGDLEQQTLTVLHRHVTRRLEREGRTPAFVINGPIAQNLRAVRNELEIREGTSGLYEVIAGLPPPAEDRLVLQWVAKASRSLVDLYDPVLAREVLESLRRKLDGGEAAVETMRRKRKVLVHALHFAVERGELGSHPLARIRWRVPKLAVAVDPRVVANPYEAGELLSAVSYVGGYRHARGRRLVGFFAGMYYAGLRPEVVGEAGARRRLHGARFGWGDEVSRIVSCRVGEVFSLLGHRGVPGAVVGFSGVLRVVGGQGLPVSRRVGGVRQGDGRPWPIRGSRARSPISASAGAGRRG